jgi:putative aldouronate transport system substrate-binding protein
MKTKKLIAGIVVSMCVSGVVVGCNQNKQTNANNVQIEGGLKPITFTVFDADVNSNPDYYQSPVSQKMLEKTGVTLEIEYNVTGDEQEKLSLMAASGQYPDMIYGKGNINIIKNAGGLIPLEDLVEKYGQNIKKVYGDYMKRLVWDKEDPSIYVLPTLDGVHQAAVQPGSGVLIQHAVVKELGYPTLRTVEDVEKVLKEYAAKYPTINNQKTIPLMLSAEDWRIMISVTNPAAFMTGAPDDGEWYVDPDTLQVQRHLTRPEEREYFRWLNRMTNEGVLYQESFIQKYDTYKSKIAAGNVLAVIDAGWNVGEAVQALRQAGMEERAFGYYPVTLTEDYKYPEFIDTGYNAGNGLSITKDCKDPERLMQFIDFMASEEGQILANWGIEGEHYTVDASGKRALLPEMLEMKVTDNQFSAKTGIDLYIQKFPHYGNTVIDSTGNPFTKDNLEQIFAEQTEIEKEVLRGYGAEKWADLYPARDEFPVKPYGVLWSMNNSKLDDPEIKAKDNRILEIGYRRIIEAILAPQDQFDAIYDKYIEEIKAAGLDDVTRAYQEALDERLELWGR